MEKKTIAELDEHISCEIDCIDIRTSQMFNILEYAYIHKIAPLKNLIISDYDYKKRLLKESKNMSIPLKKKMIYEFNKWVPYYNSLLK